MSTLILTAMESPVEALAFDYLTFGILTVVNNLWTWVAVVTAAVSLWRFKVVAGSSAGFIAPPPPTPTNSPQPATPLLEDQTLVGSKAFASPIELTPSSENFAAVVVEDNKFGGARKGVKFALYYREEVEEAEEEEEEEYEAGVAEVEVGEWWESWEEALRTRRGEKGWYRYQDLTELNGNVVRLWEGRQRW